MDGLHHRSAVISVDRRWIRISAWTMDRRWSQLPSKTKQPIARFWVTRFSIINMKQTVQISYWLQFVCRFSRAKGQFITASVRRASILQAIYRLGVRNINSWVDRINTKRMLIWQNWPQRVHRNRHALYEINFFPSVRKQMAVSLKLFRVVIFHQFVCN